MKAMMKFVMIILGMVMIAGVTSSCEKEVEVQVPGPERVVEKKVKPSDFDSTWELVDRKEKESVEEYEDNNGDMVKKTTIVYTDTYEKQIIVTYPDGSQDKSDPERKTITYDGPVLIEVQTGGEVVNPDTGEKEFVVAEYNFSALATNTSLYLYLTTFEEGSQYISDVRLKGPFDFVYYYESSVDEDGWYPNQFYTDYMVSDFVSKTFPFTNPSGNYAEGMVYSFKAPLPSEVLNDSDVVLSTILAKITYKFDGVEKETVLLDASLRNPGAIIYSILEDSNAIW